VGYRPGSCHKNCFSMKAQGFIILGNELLCSLGKRMDFTYLPMSVDIGLSTGASHFECEPPLHAILLADAKTGIKDGQGEASLLACSSQF
jgi:hypothetical protein